MRDHETQDHPSLAEEASVLPVTLLLFEGCDLLDVGGPYEVFLTANRIARDAGAPAPFVVRTASVDGRPVRAYGGLRLTPDAPLRPGPGIFLVPGAIDVPEGDASLLAAIRSAAQAADLVASVCTGSLLLAAADVLEGVPATTHHLDVGRLAERLDDHLAVAGTRWVDAGRVVTAGGLASGIAMALHLVGRFVDDGLARTTAERLEYPWSPEHGVTMATGTGGVTPPARPPAP